MTAAKAHPSEFGDTRIAQEFGLAVDEVAEAMRISPLAFVLPGELPDAPRVARTALIGAMLALGWSASTVANLLGLDWRTVDNVPPRLSGNPGLQRHALDIATAVNLRMEEARQ